MNPVQALAISMGSVITAKDTICDVGESTLHLGAASSNAGYMTSAVAAHHAANRHTGNTPMTTGKTSNRALGSSSDTAARYLALYIDAMECMRVASRPM